MDPPLGRNGTSDLSSDRRNNPLVVKEYIGQDRDGISDVLSIERLFVRGLSFPRKTPAGIEYKEQNQEDLGSKEELHGSGHCLRVFCVCVRVWNGMWVCECGMGCVCVRVWNGEGMGLDW